MSQNDIADVEYQFLAEQDVKDVDVLHFRELLAGWRLIPHTSTDWWSHTCPACWKTGTGRKAILRIALYELSKRSDVP
ncbi:hypothetical protein ACLK1T_05055 [Escherichia coli]